MNADGNSDESVVPTNPANKGGTEPPAESAEGRFSATRNTKPSNLAPDTESEEAKVTRIAWCA